VEPTLTPTQSDKLRLSGVDHKYTIRPAAILLLQIDFHGGRLVPDSLCRSTEQRSLSHPTAIARVEFNPSVQTMNRLLEDSGILDDDDISNFAFVDSIDDYYDGPSEMPVESASDPDSPFIGKTPLECSQMLHQLCQETESELLKNYFIIMDERTTRDDTVLLVSAGDDEDWPLRSVRASFEVSATRLVCYLTGHLGIEEDAEDAAETADGVFR
jgi:hypothetical protein